MGRGRGIGPGPVAEPPPRIGKQEASSPQISPQTPSPGSKDRELEALKAQARATEEQLRAIAEKISQIQTGSSRSFLVAAVDTSRCAACGACVDVCPEGAIAVDAVAAIDTSTCTGCGLCVAECPEEAITLKKG
jgi:ferredoxin